MWIIDLDARPVRLFRRPHDGAYAEASSTAAPGPTPLGALPGLSIDLSGVLD